MTSDVEEVVSFRRPVNKNRGSAFRKREAPKQASSESSGADSDSNIANSTQFKRNARKKNRMAQSTIKRKRESSESESSSNSDAEQEDAFDINTKFSSAGADKAGPSDMGATVVPEHDTAHGHDAQAQFERIQKILADKAKKEDEILKAGGKIKREEVELYQGQAMYGAKLKQDTIRGNAKSGLNRLGPIRATQYMRSSVRWDYAPDICKDYKETGFCTFGDSCKFLHDRGDYKHGWELERDWAEGKLAETKDDEFLISSEEDGSDEDMPFACFICRAEFTSPVMTKCKHYFCEKCAAAKCRVKCQICGAKTDGQLNVARDLIKRLSERKERQEQKAAKSDESDAEAHEDDDLPPEAVMENAEEPQDDVEQNEEEPSGSDVEEEDEAPDTMVVGADD